MVKAHVNYRDNGQCRIYQQHKPKTAVQNEFHNITYRYPRKFVRLCRQEQIQIERLLIHYRVRPDSDVSHAYKQGKNKINQKLLTLIQMFPVVIREEEQRNQNIDRPQDELRVNHMTRA